MSGPTELALAAGVIVEAGVKATAVLALAGGGAWLLRRRPAAERHTLWAAAVLVLPVVPLLAVLRGPALAIDGGGWLVASWALGVLLASVAPVRGLAELARLRGAAVPDPERSWLRWTAELPSPVTFGWRRPVVLMPDAARSWAPARQAVALAHEQAHVARADWLVHMGVWAVAALFWFHPLVWWARRRVAEEAEHAADDQVLATGVRPSDYASLLLAVAHDRAPAVALAMSPTARRVHAVLDRRPRSPRRGGAVVAALLAVLLGAPALASWSVVPTAPAGEGWVAPADQVTCQPAPGVLP